MLDNLVNKKGSSFWQMQTENFFAGAIQGNPLATAMGKAAAA